MTKLNPNESFGDNFHELIREMIIREIDAVHDSDWFKELWGIPTKWYERIEKLEEKVSQIEADNVQFDMSSRITCIRLSERLKDLEEFTGLYNNNEIEDARTSKQIKSDSKKRKR